MNLKPDLRHLLGPLGLLGALALVAQFRPLMPIDETRYAAVAWEMWLRGDELLPTLNDEPYAHKPPLLFWLMHAGWAVFGVGEAWPRLISPLFGAGTLWLCVRMARTLWPQDESAARIAPYVLVANLMFAYLATALMFDAMLSFFVALGTLGLLLAWRAEARAAGYWRGFACLAAGIAGALYAKGPVALLHLLPLALLAPAWSGQARLGWGRWYGGTVLALLAGAAAILAWAIPAGLAGGAAYREAIFWRQTAGRMAGSFAHAAPWWFYLAWLPLMLAPWLLWPRWWRGLREAAARDAGLRFILFGLLVPLLAFSLISGKRWQYLLPQMPLFALCVARGLSLNAVPPGRWSNAMPAFTLGALAAAGLAGLPWLVRQIGAGSALTLGVLCSAVSGLAALWLLARAPGAALRDARAVTLASVLTMATILAAFVAAMREPYDMHAVAARLARYQAEGRPVAVNEPYHGQWTFAGRLRQPIAWASQPQAFDWLKTHPQGRLLFIHRRDVTWPADVQVEYRQRYRGGWLAILAAKDPASTGPPDAQAGERPAQAPTHGEPRI